MSAAYSNQYMEQGATFNTEIALSDFYGQNYDLTFFDVYSQARKSYYSSTIDISFETYTDPANGIIQLFANNSVTANVTPGILVYDVFIVDKLSGTSTRVVEGQLFVSPSVTRF